MTTATIHSYVPKNAKQRPEMPIRHMDFQFDGKQLDDTFFRNTELASAYFEALSIFLTFGEDLGSATAMGVFAGYERQVGGVNVKIDANLMRITTEIEVFGISVEDTENKIKITPGVSYTMGKLAAEIDYDLAGDWAGINLYYSLSD